MNADWDVIRKEYVASTCSLKDLSEKYGVSVPLLKKKCAQGKWADLRNQTVTKKAKRMVTAVTEKKVKKASEIQRGADGLIAYILRCIDDGELDDERVHGFTKDLKTLREIKHDLTEYELREQEARIAALEKNAAADTQQDNDVRVEFVNKDWGT